MTQCDKFKNAFQMKRDEFETINMIKCPQNMRQVSGMSAWHYVTMKTPTNHMDGLVNLIDLLFNLRNKSNAPLISAYMI